MLQNLKFSLLFQFELKELRRRQDEDEQRRREEYARHSAGADKTDGEKSEAGSIKSGGKNLQIFKNLRKILSKLGKFLLTLL